MNPKPKGWGVSFNTLLISYFTVIATIIAVTSLLINASPNSQLSQQINAGTLTTDIRDASRVSVSSPSFTMSATSFSFNCQSGGTASTGTLGSSSQRIYIDNPNAANNGWSLTIAATGGATTLWQNTGSTANYDFNDSSGSGCTDGADADSKGGQLTLDPSVGTITTDCGSCSTSNISKGSSAAFVQSSVDSVTLLNAAASSDDIGRWYLTGVGMSQTIPAEQAADTYTISLTITVTAS